MKRKKKILKENLSRRIEVDVSGAVAQTSVTSVFALSNGTSYSILISSKIKKLALIYFRQTADERFHETFYFRLYIAGLAILLSKFVMEVTDVILDTELYGKDRVIKQEMLNYFGANLDTNKISFKQIGRKSPAHFLAKNVFLGKILPNKTVRLEDLKKFLKQKRPALPKSKLRIR